MNDYQNKNVEAHNFFRAVILFGLSFFLLALLITGDYKFYISPRQAPYLLVSTGVLFILSNIQLFRSLNSKPEDPECDCCPPITNSNWKVFITYLLFVIPLIMGFVLPEKILDSSAAAKKGVNLSANVNSTSVDKPSSTSITVDNYEEEIESAMARLDKIQNSDIRESVTSQDDNSGDDIKHLTVEDMISDEKFDQYIQELRLELLEQDLIVLDDENFLGVIIAIDYFLEEFIGKEIEMMGFVYREPGVAMNQMVVARFVMPHCVADSSVYGVLVEDEETRNFDNDTWVKIRGTISTTDYNGWEIPMVELREFEEVPPPEDPYVYPNL